MSAARSPLLRLVSIVGVLLALAGALGPGGAQADPVRPNSPDDTTLNAGREQADPPIRLTGPLSVMIELTEPSSGVTYTNATGRGASEADAAQEARTQKARIEQSQQSLLGAVQTAVPAARVLYRVQVAYNGIAVATDASAMRQLRGLPGVKAVHVIPLMERNNATSVPLIGAPLAWQNYGRTGTGITIGIIDTGIDYVHTNFGGSGLGTDYDAAEDPANNAPGTVLPVMNGATQLFPSAKVVGGYDFAGDAYDADSDDPAVNTPMPDPNPLDCNGHGSHVAGTAAGYGVSSDGTKYSGAYDTSVPFSSMRIGPGVAPEAQLYALRVFGCEGSTFLAVQAIDWAMDPNNDGDPSDHLDVVNMSLGSDYGLPDSPEVVATNNAAAAGMLLAISSGNSGDVYYVSGSPGSASRAITVASSVDSTDVVDGFDVDGPNNALDGVYAATRSVAYPWTSPPVGNPVPVTRTLYYPATNQYGCNAWTGDDANNIMDKIVLVDWRQAGDEVQPCGSALRANNAFTAGAKGIIMVDNVPTFDTGITGSATIPAMFSNSTAGDALKSQLVPGTPSSVTVTLSTAHFNQVKHLLPSQIDTISDFTSRGPRGRDNALKPDISAPGQTIFSTDVGTGNQGIVNSGTSMAAPHIAGVLALLREQHPTWSVEELKALAMNTAANDLYTGLGQTGDRYGPARVGAGRVNVPSALSDEVVAYVDDGSGLVSVSFGALEVVGTLQRDAMVRVSNKGGASVTYTIGYAARTSIPGVSYSFPNGASITVSPGSSAVFRVRLTADAAQMKNTRDPSVAATQAGNPRQWLSEASGLITLTSTDSTPLRVPVYATARPASDMTTTQSQLAFPHATGAATLNLTGQGVDTGSDYPTDMTSVVTAMELAAVSDLVSLPPDAPPSARNADLLNVGVTSARTNANNPSRVNNSTIYFGIVTQGNWTTPATEVEFDIRIDIDRDGDVDYVLYTTRLTDTDVFVTFLDKIDNTPVSGYFTNVFNSNRPTAIFNSNVLVLPVEVTGGNDGLAFNSPDTRFNYQVVTFGAFVDGEIDVSETLTYDYANPGLDFQANGAGVPMYTDRPGDIILATFNQAAYDANNSQGALLLHHYNTVGSRAQILPVGLIQEPSFNVTVTTSGPGSVSPSSGTYSETTNFTATPTDSNSIFLGWTVDGTFVGFANPLVLPVTADRTVAAAFVPRPGFSDVSSGDPYYDAIIQLAARDILRGPGDGAAHPNDLLLRAQIAGLLVRMTDWGDETPPNPFSDQCDENGSNCIDPGLWNEVAILNFHNVARGYLDNVYFPRDPVAHAQVISFITRTMVSLGYWTLASTDDPTIYPNVPGGSGHRLDLVTFVQYAGAVPGRPETQDWADWDQPASRGWTAGLLWQAYSSYFSVNRVP